jgi:O-antigen/teichoic acid export membrane protein
VSLGSGEAEPTTAADVNSAAELRFQRFASTADARKDLKGRAVRGFSHTLLLGAAEFVLRLGFTAALARLVSPEEFGLFMLVAAVTAIADQFRDLGLSTATIQRERISHREVTNLFWMNVMAGLLIAGLIAVLSPLIAGYFHEPRLTLIAIALGSTFVLGGISVQHEALLARQMRVAPKAAMRLLAFAVSSLLAIGLAAADYGYWALVWREVARSALIVGAAWGLCRWTPGWPYWRTDVRGLLKFGSGLTASYMLSTISGSLDRFLLGPHHGPAVVGLYRQSYQLVVAPMGQMMAPLYQVSLPSLSMLQKQPDRFIQTFKRIVTLVAIVSMPVGILVALFAQEITSVVLGPQWRGASVFIRIFGIGSVLQSVFSTVGFVLVSRGHSGALLRLTLAQTTCRAILMGIGTAWGAVGVAIADVASTALLFVPCLFWALHESPVSARAFLSWLARPIGGTVFMAIVVMLFKANAPALPPVVSLSTGFLLGALVFPAATVALPGGRAEWRELRSALALVRLRVA